MNLKLSLRARIAGTMLALVALSGALVASFAHIADERLEVSTRLDLLSEELTHFEHRMQRDSGAEPLRTARLRIYRAADLAELPRQIATLPPGSHSPVRWDKRYFHILVRDGSFGRLYITYDISSQVRAQRVAITLLLLGLTVTLIVTAWAAYGLSSRLVGPINRLSTRLTHIDPSKRHTRVASEFAGNELEPIARSVDSFLERLDGFVEREQSFTATASHELRTPLAVIQGAVELLNDQTRQQPPARKALGRIQRAVREMSEFTDALLTLSREEASERATNADCELTSILVRVIEDQRAISTDKVIALSMPEGNTVRVLAPETMVSMVISNLVRNAVQHGTDPNIRCELTGREVRVINQGQLGTDDVCKVFERNYTTSPGGHGMGLYLAQRICQRYGWDIALEQAGEKVVASVRV